MIYITVKQSPRFHQMTLEEFLFGAGNVPTMISSNETNTKTYVRETLSENFLRMADPDRLVRKLRDFNAMFAGLRAKDRHELYRTFHIPKKSGGLRRIDAPQPELMDALRMLKTLFESEFKAMYHTSAFAYVKKRCTLDAVKRHQANESKWFAKYDLHNFFGSTTLDYVMHMFSMIFPFNLVIEREDGKEELQEALELCFLDGVLPQGTPISPTITNIMMIPVDFKITNTLHDYNNQRYVYTRYADDFLISSRYTFMFRDIENLIVETLQEFEAPFTLNREKTRYGSSSGQNWNLGVMLNKDNKITIGHKQKKRFQAMLTNYVQDKLHGNPWDKSDIMVLEGYRNYYRMVEGENIDGLVRHIGEKFGVDIVKAIKEDLRAE